MMFFNLKKSQVIRPAQLGLFCHADRQESAVENSIEIAMKMAERHCHIAVVNGRVI
jgi:hypothetical protein